jgi:hypothetical protein
MHAEKEIVNLWLNKNGFFTISGIKVGGNREIDILAVQQALGQIQEIWHVEILSSITSIDNISYEERFNNKQVVKVLKEKIKTFAKEIEYKKILIIGKTSNIEKYNINEYTIIKMSDILFDIFKDIDTHYYKNHSIRTIQLIKHIMISEPEILAKMLDKESNVLNLNTREKFLQYLMEQDETKRVLSKKSFEPELIKIIKNSTLNKPEKLAKILDEKVLNNKSRKKFIETLLELRNMKQEIKKTIKQKTLDFFS